MDMRKNVFYFIVLAVLMCASQVRGEVSSKKKILAVAVDSLQLMMQTGDSCMQEFNTFEALKYYQQAYDLAKA